MSGFLYPIPKIMNSEILPFQLGMEYENWEFDLEPTKDRIDGYDSYIYLKEISICGVKPLRVELIFYWELLVTIILFFDDSDLLIVDKLSMQNFMRVNNCYLKCSCDMYNKLVISYLF